MDWIDVDNFMEKCLYLCLYECMYVMYVFT